MGGPETAMTTTAIVRRSPAELALSGAIGSFDAYADAVTRVPVLSRDDDLVQEGNVGLMKAVKRFDPSVGVRLVSFAVHWIRAEIHEYVLRNWRLVKVATTKAQRKLFFNLRKAKKGLAWLSADETRAVAKERGVSEHDVTEMEKRLAARDMSYDPTPEADDEDTASYSPSAYLPAPDADPAVA